MRREQLEHAIRTSCQIIHQPAIIVVGSQAILGKHDRLHLCGFANEELGEKRPDHRVLLTPLRVGTVPPSGGYDA